MNYLELIKNLINEEFLKVSNFYLKNNKTNSNSIVINSAATMYRSEIKENVFAKIQETGKRPYIAFRNQYVYLFNNLGFMTYTVKSDQLYFRIELAEFEKICSDSENKHILSDIFNNIF